MRQSLRLDSLPGTLDLSYAETPHFPGRAVVALATEPEPMKRTGRTF